MALNNLLGGLMLAPTRQDADGAAVAEGQETRLLVNEDGRLKVAAKPGGFPRCGGTLTATNVTATELAGAGAVAGTGFVAVDVSNASNVMLHVRNSGSAAMAAGQFAFEASLDSTNGTDGAWFAIQGVLSNANTIVTNTGTLSIAPGAGYASAWECSVNACSWMRVRCSTNVTASAAATWSIQRGAYATEPIPAAQISGTQPVSGTVTANMATPTALNINSAATTNATAVKTSAGTLYSIAVSNTAASARFVKLYNKASAPTVGTDVPVLTIPVAAGAALSLQFGTTGHRFATGIGLAITGAAGDADATAVAAGEVKALVAYV